MIIQINANTFWYEPGHILICLLKQPIPKYYWEHAHLVIGRFSRHPAHENYHTDPNRLYVNKMRGLCLTEYKSDLDLILEEYEIIDDGWRGQVRVSDAELTRWLLMCGS